MFARNFLCAALISVALTPTARACDLALVLAVDVSGSVSPDDYETQMHGLAAALQDGTVSEALVRAEAAITLMQWSGTSRQIQAIGWTRIDSFDTLDQLAMDIATSPRHWRNFSTAIGEALAFGSDLIAKGPTCKRHVIDVSGDGTSNEGLEPARLRQRLDEQGITVNALVIEGSEAELTEYFRQNVITGNGSFVVTANSFVDYPDRIRIKLRREVVEQISDNSPVRSDRRLQ